MKRKLSCALLIGFSLSVMIITPWCVAKFCSGSDEPGKRNDKFNKIKEISWDKSCREKDLTITPGSIQTDFGRFNFLCSIDSNAKGSLVMVDAPGAGELPGITRKLFILMNSNNTTTLFEKWSPLVNSREPEVLQSIVTVNSDELFSVLPRPDYNPSLKPSTQIQSIKWGKTLEKNGIKYVSGKTKTTHGVFEVFWKIMKGRTPELVTFDPYFAGEGPCHEIKLYLWKNSVNGTTQILEERNTFLDQKGSAYLWPIVIVKTNNLMDKPHRIQEKLYGN